MPDEPNESNDRPPIETPPEIPTIQITDELTAARAELGSTRAALAAAQQERDQALTSVQALAAERDEAHSAMRDQQSAILTAHRRALLAENRGQVIEELVQGDSAEQLAASIEAAKAAYARVADAIRAQAAAQVPAGASPRTEPPIEELSPLQKITGALTRNGR